MKIIVIAMAASNQFSNVLTRLSQSFEIIQLAPPNTGATPGIRTYPFVPAAATGGTRAARAKAAFIGTSLAVQEVLRSSEIKKPDVIFGQASFGCTNLNLMWPDCAVVSHVELPGLEMAMARKEFPLTEEDKPVAEMQRSLVCAALQSSDLVITPSAYSKSKLPNSITAKTNIVEDGFQISGTTTPDIRRQLRSIHRLPIYSPIVGYFGRTIEAVRGFDVFVNVAQKIRNIVPNTHFLVIGEKITHYGNENHYLPDTSFFDYAIKSVGMKKSDFDARPLQPITQYRQLLAATDVALFPIFENAANWSFFECLAVGTPVVVSDSCFFPEVILNDVNGYLCNLDRPEEFAQATLQLINDPAKRMAFGQAGRETMLRSYTLEHATARYESAFKLALESKQR